MSETTITIELPRARVERANEARLLGCVCAGESVLSGVKHRMLPEMDGTHVLQSSLVVVKDSYVQRLADAEGWNVREDAFDHAQSYVFCADAAQRWMSSYLLETLWVWRPHQEAPRPLSKILRGP
jgi:hypothetical protein